MKKFLCSLSSVPVFFGGVVLAQDGGAVAPTVTEIVDPDDIQLSLTTALGQWVTVGIGIGISVFVVYLGWRLLKRFTR